MGWNSWNAFGADVSAEKVKAAADALVSSGLADHGWSYINIDDCWQNNQDNPKKTALDPDFVGPARLADGSIAANRRFPDMKALAEYVHAKGLKIGIYSSPGPYTCAGHTGSFGHEAQDAKTFADWGFDYLKYDWCTYSQKQFGHGVWKTMPPYWIMGRALAHQKRDIVFSLCEYGIEMPGLWGNLVHGHSWRISGDVFDIWESVAEAIECMKPLFPYSRPGSFNDPDMLCVGPVRFNDFNGSRLAPNEQYTHISLWALVASPLMIGCDLTKLDEFTISLLINDEVLEIDQDPLGLGAGCVAAGDDWEIWARPLYDGSIAAGLYNMSPREQKIVMDMDALGMECKWRVRDVWRQADIGTFLGKYERAVPGHATHLVKFTPLKCGHLREGMDDIRDNMAEVREEADNVFAYDGKIYRHVGLWDSRGGLHLRSVCGETQSDVKFTKDNGEYQTFAPGILLQKESQLAAKSNRNPWNFSQNTFNVGMAKDQRTISSYTVNVMSGGPANDVNDWQAIWSFPDDPNEW